MGRQTIETGTTPDALDHIYFIGRAIDKELKRRKKIPENADPSFTIELLRTRYPHPIKVRQHLPLLAMREAIEALESGVYESAPTIDTPMDESAPSEANTEQTIIHVARTLHVRRSSHGGDIPDGTPPDVTENIVRNSLPKEVRLTAFVPVLAGRAVDEALKGGKYVKPERNLKNTLVADNGTCREIPFAPDQAVSQNEVSIGDFSPITPSSGEIQLA